MSSFRRRVTASPIAGTRPSPYNSLPLLSTGLSALDDLLGGGLPLSASLLLEADSPTAYADLLLKLWVSQALECKQDVVVVGTGLECRPEELVRSLPGVEGGAAAALEVEEDIEQTRLQAEKLKIAFRYKGMKQHAVTVPEPAPSSKASDTEVYCSTFDLTAVRMLRAADHARIHLIDVDTIASNADLTLPVDLYELVYRQLEETIQNQGYRLPYDTARPRKALRIAISSFGSPSWGPVSASSMYLFVHRLRTLLRNSSASAVLTFPASLYLSTHSSLVTRLEHASDGVIELQSLAASPASQLAYPRHSGLLRIPKLPNLGSLVAPSVKLSVLRGMGGGGGGGAENNLGFRVKRRKFVIETVSTDDGPVGGDEVQKRPAAHATENGDVKSAKSGASVVRFADKKNHSERKSVSAAIHSHPELYEF